MSYQQSLDSLESTGYHTHATGKQRERAYRRKDKVFVDNEWQEQHPHYPVPVKYAEYEERAIKAYIAELKQDAIYFNKEIHIDHIYPIARGGRHELRNLQALSPEDNLDKCADMTIEDYKEFTKRWFGLSNPDAAQA